MIYFVLCREANAVKIGFTSEVLTRLLYKRVSIIQGGCPLRLELVRVRDGYLEDERELHARFAASQIHGEWFNLTAELQQYMDECDRPPPFPVCGTNGVRRKWRQAA